MALSAEVRARSECSNLRAFALIVLGLLGQFTDQRRIRCGTSMLPHINIAETCFPHLSTYLARFTLLSTSALTCGSPDSVIVSLGPMHRASGPLTNAQEVREWIQRMLQRLSRNCRKF